MKVIETLYTPTDVQRVRSLLLKKQNGLDAVTGLPLAPSDAVCDHDHKTQFVRGILHRQTNVIIGKIENAWNMYLSWWYPDTLPVLLRKIADYLETDQNTGYVHPSWIKAVQIQFNKLKPSGRNVILEELGLQPLSNDTLRKAAFKKELLTRKYNLDIITRLIANVKE